MVSVMGRPLPPKPWRPPAHRPARILLVRLSALGDVIHAFPVLAALRRRLPDARIDWVVEDRFENLVTTRTEIRRLLVLPRRALRTGRARARAKALVAFVTALRRERYDVVLDLQGNFKSGVVTRLARGAVRFGLDRRAGREGNHLFTTRRGLPPPAAVHRVERNLALLSLLLGEAVAWEDPGLGTDPDAAAAAEAALARGGASPRGFVVLHPGTSRFGAFKRWPADRFRDLAARLAADGEEVVVTAPPQEAALADEASGRGTAARLVVTDGLPALSEVLARARLVVAADTGPLHLAALAGTPVLGLFGPKDPAVYGPWGRRADGTAGVLDVWVRSDVACRPCRLRRCGDPVCMTGMAPARVHAAAIRLLRPA